MSFIHDLTIGFLDLEAVARREVVALGRLTAEVQALLEASADRDSLTRVGDVLHFELGGQPARMTPEVAVLRWHAPAHNRAATALALKCSALGCLVADIAHARIVSVEELEPLCATLLDSPITRSQ